MATTYFSRYGDHAATLAQIAAKNHANGVTNPWAHIRKDVGFDFCNTISDKNPLIAAPLRKTDCSLVSDGAAALVIVDASLLSRFKRAVQFRARSHISDFLPMSRRDAASFAGPQRAWHSAYQQAGCTVNDLSFAEVHDCFTIAELLAYEAMGLAPSGEGRRVVDDGTVFADGRLPINRSGGLKAKGHPIGATGVSMHVIAAMQLCGEAGAMQLAGPQLAGVFNMGGSAVANYVSILEAVR
jgi:acetyl-CoA C-acetyltransferase